MTSIPAAWRVWSKVPDGVVPPVVYQAELHQSLAIDRVMDRHEFHGGHPEALEVTDDRLSGESRIRALKLRRNVGVARRHSLHVGFVDDGLVPGNGWRAVVCPDEGGIDHRSERSVRGVVLART